MKKDAAREALVQEARELIVVMEASLLQIESEGPSRDAIHGIFRAAHTIKGSAGLFAFDSVVSFTHLLENVLDKVRNEVLPLDEVMMSLLLNCGDYLDDLVDAIAQFKEDQDPDPHRRAELEGALNGYLEQVAAIEAAILAMASAVDSLPASEPEQIGRLLPSSDAVDDEAVANAYWHLSLRFHPEVLRDGLDPLSFLRYLLTMGRATYLHVIDSAMPAAEDMDPEQCYLGYEIGFAGNVERDIDQTMLESIFEFVRDDSHIIVLPPHATLGSYRQWLAQLPEREQVAALLRQSHAISEMQWQALQPTLDVLPRLPLQLAPQMMRVTQAAQEAQAAPLRSRSSEEKILQERKFIKIEVDKLDQLIDLVGELVIAGAGASLLAKHSKEPRLEEANQLVSGLVEQIRDAALTLRMVQIKEVFQRFPRVVRDMSREIGKDIELIITGADTELDKSMVEKISDPLMHIVRNAVDHGIEPIALRRAAGKPETGILRLNATHESGSIVIEVFDDGYGLDPHKIRQRAIRQGFLAADAVASESELFRLIFEPGFTTAERVTALSGRGVGMDVVKRNIESLQGEVDLFSHPGQGTMVRIRLPLTLAIIAGFQVMVGEAVFVIPLDLVVECINLSAYQVDNHVVTLRGESLPFLALRELFDLPHKESPRKSLVIVQYGQWRAGLLVDGLLGECQAVIKPLGKLFSKVKGLSGSTILGDGRVALILDVPHLLTHTGKRTQVEMAPLPARAGQAGSDE